ncbi:restriction endonuclease subunit S [Halomonas sp. XH26]|uniref:restriction endonuclease subunit S n=1 Tax=Halomonas sp. XH26 TaxID=2557993 RepID=UPI00209C7044|nr:restriction endonuclease subunit S [Halomonas sp. XH26]UTA81529.1 restriction endonuclease subunit S [Halomonas sp. XH26]
MSYPAYPEYKDSGVEWLGEVPVHWEVTALKRGHDVVLGKMLQPEPKQESDQLLPYLRAANIQPTGVDLKDVRKMWFSPSEARQLALEYGDLLISEGGDVGRPALWSNGSGYHIQNSINRVRPNANNCSSFLFYWMLAIKQKGYVDVLCNKSTIAHFTAEKVASVPTPFPPGSEQTQIATFLDHETVRIDALVEEQQRLIALLKEKRQAVISHAVTKGLDPEVPMKDSGVEWLGEVPAHWAVGPLRWYATIQGGIAKGKSYDAETPTVELPYLRVANVQDGYVDLSTVKTVEVAVSEIERYRLREGDVLMNEGGDNDKLGRGTVWKGEVTDCLHQNHVFAIRPNHFLLPQWLSMFTRSNTARAYFYLYSKQSTNLASISSSSVMSCPLPLPPVQEQRQVLDFLAIEAARLDDLMQESIETINLLQERRSALISAAVTGKIDVRGWQPPEDSVLTGEASQMEVV